MYKLNPHHLVFTWWSADYMYWQWCGTESVAKMNCVGWGDFPLCFTTVDRELCNGDEMAPVAHQTSPNMERSPATAQLIRTPDTCISSAHWHTPLACFGDRCSNVVPGDCIYASPLHMATSQCHGVFFWTSEHWGDVFRKYISDQWLSYPYSAPGMISSVFFRGVFFLSYVSQRTLCLPACVWTVSRVLSMHECVSLPEAQDWWVGSYRYMQL